MKTVLKYLEEDTSCVERLPEAVETEAAREIARHTFGAIRIAVETRALRRTAA